MMVDIPLGSVSSVGFSNIMVGYTKEAGQTFDIKNDNRDSAMYYF